MRFHEELISVKYEITETVKLFIWLALLRSLYIFKLFPTYEANFLVTFDIFQTYWIV